MEHNKLDHCYCFESYGVRVRIESNSREILESAVATACSVLLGCVTEIDCESAEQVFSFPLLPSGDCSIIQNGQTMVTDKPDTLMWKYFDSLARILIAEFAKEHVFLHAGVVGWKGKAIVLPGNSFFGKSTLVADLVRNGAEYYSDEYAILDSEGLNHPFARPLTLRPAGKTFIETETPVEEINGKARHMPIPVGLVLFTRFVAESTPNYQYLTTGQGVVEIIAQTIAIKRNTEFAINVLKKALSSAIIVKSPRPDAGSFAREFLEFVDNTAI